VKLDENRENLIQTLNALDRLINHDRESATDERHTPTPLTQFPTENGSLRSPTRDMSQVGSPMAQNTAPRESRENEGIAITQVDSHL
jgi:hypothetical protein